MGITTKRICKDAVLLAILCVVGMFFIPLGENIKVSLQFLIVLIICLIADSHIDAVLITAAYLGLGMFLPVYAGFASGVSPTFGYIIGFVVISVPTYFISKIKAMNEIARLIIASVVALLLVYTIGTIWMMFFLNLSLEKTLIVSVLPYIPFDIFKIAVAITIYKLLPARLKGN